MNNTQPTKEKYPTFIRDFIKKYAKLIRFGIVGVSNTLVDIGVFALLASLLSVQAAVIFVVIKIASFVIANINSYVWNKLWVFEETSMSIDEPLYRQIFLFFSVSVVGLIINVISFAVINFGLTKILDTRLLIIGMVSVLLAALVSMTWNFVGYKIFVFEKK